MDTETEPSIGWNWNQGNVVITFHQLLLLGGRVILHTDYSVNSTGKSQVELSLLKDTATSRISEHIDSLFVSRPHPMKFASFKNSRCLFILNI